MPRKVRELLIELERAGFLNRGGKGSHRNYAHASGIRITVAGQPRDDAKPYQEKDVARAIREAEEKAR
jgi:predicted RNA binding protein YcfA (HicA-like mRNA interferase family)